MDDSQIATTAQVTPVVGRRCSTDCFCHGHVLFCPFLVEVQGQRYVACAWRCSLFLTAADIGADLLWTTPQPSSSLLWSLWFTNFLFSTVLWCVESVNGTDTLKRPLPRFSRISLVLCVSRIFKTTRPEFRIVAVVLVTCFLCFYITTNLVSALSCDSIKGAPWYILDFRSCTHVGKETPLSLFLSIICGC